jgi:hypothetical protein
MIACKHVIAGEQPGVLFVGSPTDIDAFCYPCAHLLMVENKPEAAGLMGFMCDEHASKVLEKATALGFDANIPALWKFHGDKKFYFTQADD